MKSPNIYNHLGKETLNPKKANHQNSKSSIKKIKIPNRQCRGIYSYNCKAWWLSKTKTWKIFVLNLPACFIWESNGPTIGLSLPRLTESETHEVQTACLRIGVPPNCYSSIKLGSRNSKLVNFQTLEQGFNLILWKNESWLDWKKPWG